MITAGSDGVGRDEKERGAGRCRRPLFTRPCRRGCLGSTTNKPGWTRTVKPDVTLSGSNNPQSLRGKRYSFVCLS